jgi:hypothetical protein
MHAQQAEGAEVRSVDGVEGDAVACAEGGYFGGGDFVGGESGGSGGGGWGGDEDGIDYAVDFGAAVGEEV